MLRSLSENRQYEKAAVAFARFEREQGMGEKERENAARSDEGKEE